MAGVNPPQIFPLGFVADTTLRLDQADFTDGGTVSGNFRSSLLTFNPHPFMDADVDGWSDFDEKFCGTDAADGLFFPVDTDNDKTCNVLDADDDGDSWSDSDEVACGTESLNSESVPTDTDSDLLCDVVDADDDGDGILDGADSFPLDATEDTDTDGDGTGDNADTDDDGDGYSDEDELLAGTDPLDASVYPVPEPAAFLLSLTALLTLAGLRRLPSSRREARPIG